MPLGENTYADWSCHLFAGDRAQYIILTNSASLYSCVMCGRGITDDSTFIARALDAIREFTADDGKQFIYRKFIAPSSGTVSFAKSLNRSVTGSMHDYNMLKGGLMPLGLLVLVLSPMIAVKLLGTKK